MDVSVKRLAGNVGGRREMIESRHYRLKHFRTNKPAAPKIRNGSNFRKIQTATTPRTTLMTQPQSEAGAAGAR